MYVSEAAQGTEHYALHMTAANNQTDKTRFEFDERSDFSDPERKQKVTRDVFDRIAPAYDHFTPGLSLFRDQAWKREIVRRMPSSPNPACLDLACGTGDLTFLLAERFPAGRIIGADITDAMLEIARKRSHFANVEFRNLDMMNTGLPAESFDIVTGGYALRNAPDLDVALTEIHRLLKPGGVAAFLDFSNSSNRIARKFNSGLLRFWSGLWGVCLFGNPKLLTYITASLSTFPDRAELRARFVQHGFEVEDSILHMMGMLESIFIRKAAYKTRSTQEEFT